MEFGPHTGFRPLGEPAMRRLTGRAERDRRQLLPLAARGRYEDGRGQDLTVTVATPAAALRP